MIDHTQYCDDAFEIVERCDIDGIVETTGNLMASISHALKAIE